MCYSSHAMRVWEAAPDAPLCDDDEDVRRSVHVYLDDTHAGFEHG